MKLQFVAAVLRGFSPSPQIAALPLALACFASCAVTHAQTADIKAAEVNPAAEIYQTLYLTNLTQQNDLNDIQTDLRNMLPRAHLYGMPSQNAISIRATSEDIQIAQKVLADLDRGKKLYLLTYTINESDNGTRSGTQTFALVAASGERTIFKQGSKVPIVTGTFDSDNFKANTQVQYLDVGLSIDFTVEGRVDGLGLRSKVEQSSLAEEKSGVGPQDPVVRQSVVDSTTALTLGKPLVLGSLGIPGSTRTQQIEVVAELVK